MVLVRGLLLEEEDEDEEEEEGDLAAVEVVVVEEVFKVELLFSRSALSSCAEAEAVGDSRLF